MSARGYCEVIQVCVHVNNMLLTLGHDQWRIQEFGKGGGHVGVWGLAPSGVQGQRPGGGSGGLRPPEAERFPLKLLVKLCNI